MQVSMTSQQKKMMPKSPHESDMFLKNQNLPNFAILK